VDTGSFGSVPGSRATLATPRRAAGSFRRIADEVPIRRAARGPFKPVAPSAAVRSSLAAALRSPLVVAGAAVLLIGLLSWPMLFTAATFNGDWIGQAWFLWQQSLAIRADHAPTLFLNYPFGVFYPHFAFYGGTLYAITGALSLLLGDAPMATYVLVYLMGFAAAYGGWYWIGRICGLGRWSAQAPGLVFVTSSYFITQIYARGDWPEFVGVAAIPLVMGAGLSVLRADRLRLWPALALTVASIFFFGSHSLTIVWGFAMMAVAGLALVALVPNARRTLTRAGAVRVAGIVAPAALVSAWFLLPAASYESKTLIATEYRHWQLLLRGTQKLVSPEHLFTLSRASASTPGAAFALSLPILVMAWALLTLAVFLRRGLHGTWIRVLLICSAMTTLLIVTMTHAGMILALPRVFSTIQFSYRLESYVLLALTGTVLAALVLVRSGGPDARLSRWTLLPVLLVSVVGAVQQTDAYPNGGDRNALLNVLYTPKAPGAGELLTDYVDVHQRILNAPNGRPPEVRFPFAAVHENHVTTVVHMAPGQLAYSNLEAPPVFVHVTGAKIVGINGEGFDVLEINRSSRPEPAGAGGKTPTPAETISVGSAEPLPVVAGRWISILALAALFAQFAALALRRLRRRSGSEGVGAGAGAGA
jgi:hypothetical protein